MSAAISEQEESTQGFARRILVERRRLLIGRGAIAPLQRARVELARVVAALDRLDNGSWGACFVCGRGIAELRLRAEPETTRCSACADHD